MEASNQALGDPAPAVCKDYVRAVLDGDSHTASRTIDSALRLGLSVQRIYADVFTPTLIELGTLWHGGKISIAQEHLASQITIDQMARLRSMVIPQASLNLHCVVATVHGDAHAIGSQMIADYLLWDGWSVDYLGSHTPAEDLVRFCENRNCDLLCLSVTLPEHLAEIKIVADKLAKLSKPPKLLVGGAAIKQERATLKRMGADAAASDGDSALRETRNLFNLDEPAPLLDSYLKRLGECIRSARKVRELNQQELALRCSLDRAYLSSLENGKQNVTIAALVRIAQALGLTVEDLLSADKGRIVLLLSKTLLARN